MNFKYFLLLTVAIVISEKRVHGEDNGMTCDLVIQNGRGIDPASGMNELMNVGGKDGTIVEISANRLVGSQTIDATGKIVAPGFIDLHMHSPFPFGEELQALDGGTTALDLEAGAYPPSEIAHSAIQGSPMVDRLTLLHDIQK